MVRRPTYEAVLGLCYDGLPGPPGALVGGVRILSQHGQLVVCLGSQRHRHDGVWGVLVYEDRAEGYTPQCRV